MSDPQIMGLFDLQEDVRLAIDHCWRTPCTIRDIRQQVFFDTGIRYGNLEVCNAVRGLVTMGLVIAEKRVITDPHYRPRGYPHKLQPYVTRLLVFGPKSNYYKEKASAERG